MRQWFADHNPIEYFRNLIKYSLKGRNSPFILFSLIVIVLGILLYFQSGRMTQNSLYEQMQHREQVIARAGAESMAFFLRDVGRSLELLARKPAVAAMGPDAQGALDRFIVDWRSTPVVGVNIIDTEGNVLFNSNRDGVPMEKGVSLADRDFFKWLKGAKEGEVFWGKAIVSKFGLTKGQYVIPIATPIFDQGGFKGAVVAVILVSELSKTTLEPLKISDATQVYLVNSAGDFMVSYYPQLTGTNMLDYLKKHPFPGSRSVISIIESRLGTKFEGKLDVIYPDLSHDNKLTRFLLAYSPILVGDRNWSLVIATPAEDAMEFSWPFYSNQFVILVFFVIFIIGYAVLSITLTRKLEKEAYLKGYKEGVEHGPHDRD